MSEDITTLEKRLSDLMEEPDYWMNQALMTEGIRIERKLEMIRRQSPTPDK